jgi:4-alpha-glucanotransferase
LIAEDLGHITPYVREVISRFDLPGMRLLLFAFGEGLPENPYAPHNHIKNCVVYTGTHDNNTARGWFEREARPEEKAHLFKYLGRELRAEDVSLELIRMAMMSVADTAIVPMQDILGLGEDARMNRPGSTKGNYEWRLLSEQLKLDGWLREMAEIYNRA